MQNDRFLRSLATKPFVILTGNSGTGKTKLAELFAHWLCGKDSEDYTLVPVGSDWTDNRNVLGFVNHLRKASDASSALPVYQSTPILDLILRAVDFPNNPHFLILDEMNLSNPRPGSFCSTRLAKGKRSFPQRPVAHPGCLVRFACLTTFLWLAQ